MKIIPRKLRKLGTTLVETLPPIGLVGFLATSLLPALGKAKARANRVKCVSNIKQVGGAFKAFANDNDGRMPWLLEDRDKIAQSGARFGAPGNAAWGNETSTLFAQGAIRSMLGSAKILVSPLDPDRQGVNDEIDLANVDLRGNPVPNEGHSYGAVNGEGGPGKAADEARPGTVVTVTRNISGPANKEESLSDQGGNPLRATAKKFAFWKGADKHPADARTMAYLNSNAGQLGAADGSAGQSNDASLQDRTRAHHKELGGNFRGSPSGFLDTPND